MALGLWPPILRGATLPVSWNRRTQLITVLGATPNRAATRCRDSPPSKTAATARSRRSIDKGLAIHAGLLSSQHVESVPEPIRESQIDSAQSHPALDRHPRAPESRQLGLPPGRRRKTTVVWAMSSGTEIFFNRGKGRINPR